MLRIPNWRVNRSPLNYNLSTHEINMAPKIIGGSALRGGLTSCRPRGTGLPAGVAPLHTPPLGARGRRIPPPGDLAGSGVGAGVAIATTGDAAFRLMGGVPGRLAGVTGSSAGKGDGHGVERR